MLFERESLLYKYAHEVDGKGIPLSTIKFPEDYTGERTLSDLYKLNKEAFEGVTYMISCYMIIVIYQEYHWEGEFNVEKILNDKTNASWAKIIEFEGKKTVVFFGGE